MRFPTKKIVFEIPFLFLDIELSSTSGAWFRSIIQKKSDCDLGGMKETSDVF